MNRSQILTCICERADLSIEISPLSGDSAGPRQTREPIVGITSCPSEGTRTTKDKRKKIGQVKQISF